MENKYGTTDVDYMKLLYEDNDVSVYELDAIYLGENANGMYISRECAEKSLPSFADKPLYCIIDNKWNPLDGKNNDFMEHFREEYPDVVTRDRILPFGCVPESAIKDAKFIERDGHTYLRMNVVVWKKLLPHVSDILQRRDGTVKISVEFVILNAKQDEKTGLIYVDEFEITAITALGEKFKEIMDGTKLKSVKFSYTNYTKESENNYCAFASQKSYNIPENITNSMKSGISLREKCGRGGTKAIYNSLKAISESGIMYENQLADAKKYFSVFTEQPKESNPPTSKQIVYNMFGNKEGIDWFNSIVCNGSSEAIKDKGKGGSSELEVKIEIDNKKESAVNSSGWENPGKALYEPILKAPNKKSLVDEAYLIVEDGYEEAPSEKLKYPHHIIRNGKLILDVAGVKAAFVRAAQQGIDKGVVKAHLERHYKELGLSMENFEVKNAELESSIKEKDEAFAKLNEEFSAKCAEMEECSKKMSELEEKCSSSDLKCAELQEQIGCLNAQLKEKSEKLAEYEKKETVETNMAMIQECCGCFDEEQMEELKTYAETMSCDAMKGKMAEAVMSFAKGYSGEALKKDAKFSVNPFYNYHKDLHENKDSDIEKIIKKSKTKVI